MSCEHCDDSVPHDHDAVPNAVEEAARRARLLLIAQVSVAVVVLLACLVLVPLEGWPVPLGWGLATWAAATGSGAMAGTWARSGRDISTPSVAMRVRLTAGIAAAVVLVLGAVLAAAESGGRYVGGIATPVLHAWQVALAVSAGWFLGAGILAAVQTYGWLRILRTKGDAGELIRAGVMHSALPKHSRALAAYLLPGVMIGVWTLTFAWLVWLVVIAVPLQVLAAIAMTKK